MESSRAADGPASQGSAGDQSYETQRLKLGAIFYVFLMIAVALLAGGLLGKSFGPKRGTDASNIYSAILTIGAAGLSLMLFLLIAKLLINNWVMDKRTVLAQAFQSRDRRGRRLPSRALMEGINRLDEDDHYLTNQPNQFLLALAASTDNADRYSRLKRMLNVSSNDKALATLPGNTVLTRVDFAIGKNVDEGVSAARTLPARLWTRAVTALFSSLHPEVRITAVRFPNLPRRQKIRACGYDVDVSVREAAWEQVRGDISESEVNTLIESPNPDSRVRIIEAGLLSDQKLIVLCKRDDAYTVRKAAWKIIKSSLTKAEAARLVRSRFADVRYYVIYCGLLANKTLIKLAYKDTDDRVRKAAFANLFVTAKEAKKLLRSRYADTRARAVKTVSSDRDVLLSLCLKDDDELVREAAWSFLQNGLTKKEARVLTSSRHSDIRLRLAEHPDVSEAALSNLVLDEDVEIRKVALRRSWVDLNAGAMEKRAKSKDEASRLAVAESRYIPRGVLLSLVSDQSQTVRQRALSRILEDASNQEFNHIAKSRFPDILLAIAKHPRAPREILINFVIGSARRYSPFFYQSMDILSVALPRVLEGATDDELGRLLAIGNEQIKIAVANHDSTPDTILQRLATDSSAKVREITLPKAVERCGLEFLYSLLESNYQDVKRAAIRGIGDRHDRAGVERIAQHLTDLYLQQDAVDALLKIEGAQSIFRMVELIGVGGTFKLVEQQRLVECLREQFEQERPEAIADLLASIQKVSKSIRVGSTTVTHDDYDSYGSYSSYTSENPENVTASYYSPKVISATVEIMKALKDTKRESIMWLLKERNAELASLIEAGLEGQDWQNKIVHPMLDLAKGINVTGFTPASYREVVSQLD